MIRVLMDPEQRKEYLEMILKTEGFPDIREDPKAAYCTVSLTSTPEELRSYVGSRQELLKNVLKKAGINAYDPKTAPYSPELNLTAQPREVYAVDFRRVAEARYLTGHNILPSSGLGTEMELAKTLNRIPVILMDKKIRISRMMPHRTIYLQYDNFEEQQNDFSDVFKMLQEYEPGTGFNGSLPALLGFVKKGSKVVDLEEEIYREFPHLQYVFDGNVPIIKLRAENPELLCEYR